MSRVRDQKQPWRVCCEIWEDDKIPSRHLKITATYPQGKEKTWTFKHTDSWLTRTTRIELETPVGFPSRFIEFPTEASKYILKWLINKLCGDATEINHIELPITDEDGNVIEYE